MCITIVISRAAGAQTQHPGHHHDAVEDGAVERVQQGADREDDELQHLQPRSHLRLRVGQEDERPPAVQAPGVLVTLVEPSFILSDQIV